MHHKGLVSAIKNLLFLNCAMFYDRTIWNQIWRKTTKTPVPYLGHKLVFINCDLSAGTKLMLRSGVVCCAGQADICKGPSSKKSDRIASIYAKGILSKTLGFVFPSCKRRSSIGHCQCRGSTSVSCRRSPRRTAGPPAQCSAIFIKLDLFVSPYFF